MDPVLADALFLYTHPSWSPSDLESGDQDLVDLLDALQHEQAVIANEQHQKVGREQWAARNRTRR